MNYFYFQKSIAILLCVIFIPTLHATVLGVIPETATNDFVLGETLFSWEEQVPPPTFVTFTDQSALLQNTNFHSGVAIGIADMNGDGKDDIIRLDNARILNIEYQNAPNAAFSNTNFGSVSSSNQWSLCIGDADGNGYNDILTGGSYDNIKLQKANGSGTSYTTTTLPSSNIFIQGSNFVDINNDGSLDIFACHDDAESRKWENDGNGNYTLNNNLIPTITVPASDNSGNYASIWTDYDNDGDLDMYLSKCRGGVSDPTDPRRINQLFRNDGNNTFTEVAGAAGLKIGDQTWSADFADIDNDGDMDVFMLNHYTPSLMFENNGDGTFTDITTASGLDQNMNLFGIQGIFRDFDNDGFVDLIVTGTQHRMFKNNGDQTFTEIANPFTSNWIESLAIGDLNGDGFLDIYAGYANLFTTPSAIDDQLFMNQGNANNWIDIDLKGTVSNINGIGARVELHGSWGIQIREVRSGEGYGIHNSFHQHFGLGTASQITKVVVKWTSGIVNEINNPSINQVLTIVESTPPPFVSFTDESSALLQTTNFYSGIVIGISDMNSDGKDDIVRLNNAQTLNIEYQNAPNAMFSNSNFGNVSGSNEWSLCIGDADQNGYNDILVGGAYDDIKLLKANSDGTSYTTSILPSSNIFIQGSNFVDINNDGALDIFACHDDAESRKWENDGNGNYTLNNNLIPTITVPASDNSGNYASIWTDYDNDGDLDMYLSKCRGGVTDPTDPRRINQLFQNDGNNNFTEVAGAAGLKVGDQTWTSDFADIDNDGDMDVFMLNHSAQSLIFENNGDGTFTDITIGSGFEQNINFFGRQSLFRDFDNDGFVDLVVAGTQHRMF
ncbi:MAG TPA: hypothetical protein ENJ53_00390, partial [Phaeodactylibacter sp.]|nr:hypothetical protein [Phaeodactylibacter sp.]